MKRSISIKFSVSIILLATIVFYTPIILNPSLILNRNNDLQEQFWPNFHFIKEQFLETYTPPLWNNNILSGTPLLPDPQAGLFYPPNFLFLIFPTDQTFLIIFFLHTLFAGIGIYLLLTKSFQLSQKAGLLVSTFYIFSPKQAAFLEAGHYGLATSLTWPPFILFSLIMLFKKPSLIYSIILSLSLAGLFYANLIIFLLSLISIFLIALFFILFENKRNFSHFAYLLLSVILTFCLTAISLLPLLEWSGETTRYLLLQEKITNPTWFSIKEVVSNSFFLWTQNYSTLWNLDSEKWIPLGLGLSVLALVGLLSIKKWIVKLTIIVFIIFIFLTLANNSSPIYRFLLTQDWFLLMRTSTRAWILLELIFLVLAAFGLDNLLKSKKKLVYFIFVISILELGYLSLIRSAKPIEPSPFVPKEVYEFISSKISNERVYCTSRCLSQKYASLYSLQLIEGYNPLIQTNYNQQAWQLTGAYWKNYTHTIPSIDSYTFGTPQPDPVSLGDYNTKYIISPYPLTNENFHLEKNIDHYFIYTNRLLKPRAYFTQPDKPNNFTEAAIIKYSPNEIIVNTTNQTSRQLTLAEVYSNGWKAYLNGKMPAAVQEKPNRLRLVDLQSDTKFVVFEYKPLSYEIGKWVSLTTIILCLLLLQYNKQFKKI